MNTIVIEKSKNNDFYQNAAFVVSACADKDDPRLVLQNVLIDNGKMIATDGNRLHLNDFTDSSLALENGQYSVTKTAKQIVLLPVNDPGNFPDYNRVIPLGEGAKTELSGNYIVEKIIAIVAIKNDGHAAVNLNYLKPIVDANGPWTISTFEKLGPVKLQNCTKTAIIMPCNI